MFDLDEHVARYAGLKRECFLCQPLLDAEGSDLLADRPAVSTPRL